MTQYTENYRLELYEGTDKADLTDQYNVSMGILDGAMKGVVDDTDASVAGIQADLATTNSNLSATNINLAALNDKVDANQTAQATTNLNFQNEIDTLKTTVDKNTPLVNEHVNYFAQLGVTDVESATNLRTQMNQTQETADDALAQSVENAADIAKLSLDPKQSDHIQNARVVLNSAPSGFNGSMEKVYEYTVGPLLFFGLKFVSEPYSSTALSFNKILFDNPGIFAKNGDIPCGNVSGGVYFKKTGAAYVNDVRPFTDMQLHNGYVLVTAAATSYTPSEDNSSLHVVANFCMIVSPTTEPITYSAYPDLSSANGGVGTTKAKFSGSVDAGGKLVMGNLAPLYNFASALGSGEVSLPTRKIVIANIASSDVVQVPTSIRVYSASLSGSQTYPVSYANGELSFTPTTDNNSLGQHTGAASSKTLILSLYYSYDTTPNPPVEPTPTATFGAVPSLETEGGNDGSTTAKFSGSIAGKKLTVNNLSATYEFTSRLGEDLVYMPTSKIVVATVENGTGVEVPTSVKVSSSTLESSQTYPLTYVGGVLSFTPTAQTRDLGAHTGGTSTKELTLMIEFIANGGAA